jgi:hypothetical protein
MEPDLKSSQRLHGRFWRRATRAVVRRHRATIVAVAEALFARGTLTGDEIDTLVQF